jgi:hypothetical protein
MMTMPTATAALITSKDPKGLHALGLFEAAYNKAGLDDAQAQRLNERGGELKDGISALIRQLIVTDLYKAEEVKSSYTYPRGYKGPKPLSQQIDALAGAFGLSLGGTTEFIDKTLPTLALPNGSEGWFAIPSIAALAARHFPEVKDPKERYTRAVELVLAKIGESRSFYNYRDGEILPDRWRLNARTAHALDILAEQQPGDIWIVGGQFGKRHAGRSVRRAREVMVGPEFGGYAVAAGSMLLTHPERLVSYDDLWYDVPGDEFDPHADGAFDGAPYFGFRGGRVGFDAYFVGSPRDGDGSVSLFLPQ